MPQRPTMRWYVLGLAVLVAAPAVVIGRTETSTVLPVSAPQPEPKSEPKFEAEPQSEAEPKSEPKAQPKPKPKPVTITVIGDSHTSGSAEDSGRAARWPALVRDSMGVRVQLLAAGGSGYLRAGREKPEVGTFVDRASRVRPDADIVIFFGSINDRDQSAARVGAASSRAFKVVRKRHPTARLVVVGPVQVTAVAKRELAAMNEALHEAAIASRASWVDPVGQRWLSGPSDVGADGYHPTDRGHRRLAEHFSAIIAAASAEAEGTR